MSEISENLSSEKPNLKFDGTTLSQDDVVQQRGARAAFVNDLKTELPESDIPTKKRKTRRGKSKRKPYQKYGSINKKYSKLLKNKIIKPEAPHNSNQFLLEDHGIIEELDENLKCADQASTSTLTRTRDSSLSVDSDGEFYSSPDDEEKFLMKDFDDQYRSIQVEQLQTMSKLELIEEYMLLENRYQQEQLARRSQKQKETDSEVSEAVIKLQKEVEKLRMEKEQLQRENEMLKSKLEAAERCSMDSEDSETDSSDSCSSSSSSSSSSSCQSKKSPNPSQDAVENSLTNGHTSPPTSVDPV